MKRGLWTQQNTVTLSVLALKPVSPNDIIHGHKFVKGAFVDIRKPIKQEPMGDSGSSASNPSTNTKRTRKGDMSKGRAVHHGSDDNEETSSVPEPDVISIDDDTDSARSSSSCDEETPTSASSCSEEEASSSSDESSSDEED